MKKVSLLLRSFICFLVPFVIVFYSTVLYGFDKSYSSLLEKYQHELSQLQLIYTDKHPDVKKLKRKIRNLEKQIVDEQESQKEFFPSNSDKQQIQQQDRNPSILENNINHGIPTKPLTKNKPEIKNQVKAAKVPVKEPGAEISPKEELNEKPFTDKHFFTDNGILNVPVSVKETAGVGVKTYPVTAVIPLPFGKYQETERFRIVDSEGATVPAQFEVLNRWWARGKSIRHLLVHFQPSVPPFSSPGSGISTYYLRDDDRGGQTAPTLTVEETEKGITVITGPLKFSVTKKNFNILDEVWLDLDKNNIFDESEKTIQPNPQNGGVFIGRLTNDVQLDSFRNDINFTIEEKGPMRVVIKAEAPTIYVNPENHNHGFAVRIYAYAGKPFIKIDYQLQNSANNAVFSWPLYFEEMNLDFRLSLIEPVTVRAGIDNGMMYEHHKDEGLYLAQESHDKFNIYDLKNNQVLLSGQIAEGFIDVRDTSKGVAAFVRHCWQMWPNGLEINGNNRLQIQLFPRWSSQWRQREKLTPGFTDTGLYWLQDMQHVYKEILLLFHSAEAGDDELINLARTFQQHPVATLPTAWYLETQATLDMGGKIPLDQKIPVQDLRTHSYHKFDFNVKKSSNYNFGWNQFLLDINRKWGVSQGGGWPYSVASLIATENPADYFFAEQFAIGELNVRPQWLAEYDFERDWHRLQLTENPYAGISWRKIDGGNYKRHFDAPFLEGTNVDTKPRDDAHGWFYHVEEAYYFTGNLWIRDWYDFIAEFRKTRLNHLDPVTDFQTRATAHALAHALQAFRVTGDMDIISGVNRYINTWLRNEQSPVSGAVKKGEADSGFQKYINKWFRDEQGPFSKGEADRASWVGYLSRAIINFMEEVKGNDLQAYATAFNYLSGLMEWNYLYSNFGYTTYANQGQIDKSSDTAQNLADPQAWYYWHTGKKKYLDHLNKYINEGINKGQKARKAIKNWKGRFQGRWVQFVRENEKHDMQPPSPIIDLKAIQTGNYIELSWTAPHEAIRYHLVWSDKPIVEETTTDPFQKNWWAADVMAFAPVDAPGESIKIRIRRPKENPLYVAVFSFDENENMSRISNLASPNNYKQLSQFNINRKQRGELGL